MASVYPGSLDSLATTKSNATTNFNDHAAHHNDLADAVNKIEAELGINPRGAYATAKARLDALEFIVENIQTASYTLVLADAGVTVTMNSASANNLTVPTNASVAFPVGTTIPIFQLGVGQTTIVMTSLTAQSPGGKLKLAGQFSSAVLWKRATDTWAVAGDLVL